MKTIFTIQAQGMFFEIDLSSLINNINSIYNKDHSNKVKNNNTNYQKYVNSLNSKLTSSEIKIKKRQTKDSLCFESIENAKLVEYNNGIYLKFSVKNDFNYRYTFNFKLINNINYSIKRKSIIFVNYSITKINITESKMEKILKFGLKNNFTVNKIWKLDFKRLFFISSSIVGVLFCMNIGNLLNL